MSPLRSPGAISVGAAAFLKCASEKKDNKLFLLTFKSCFFAALHAYKQAVRLLIYDNCERTILFHYQHAPREPVLNLTGRTSFLVVALPPTAAYVRCRVVRGHKAIHQRPDSHIDYGKGGNDSERRERMGSEME